MRFLNAFPTDDVTIITISDRGESSRWLGGLGDTHLELGMNGLGRRNLWAARLDETVHEAPGRVVLAAESVSCFALMWWARLSPADYLSTVAGALLLDPLGTGAMRPSLDFRQFSAPSTALPFPSILYSPGGGAQATEQAIALAASWGSRFAHADALDVLASGEGCDTETEQDLAQLLVDVVSETPALPAPDAITESRWSAR